MPRSDWCNSQPRTPSAKHSSWLSSAIKSKCSVVIAVSGCQSDAAVPLNRAKFRSVQQKTPRNRIMSRDIRRRQTWRLHQNSTACVDDTSNTWIHHKTTKSDELNTQHADIQKYPSCSQKAYNKLGEIQAGLKTSPYAVLAITDMVKRVHRMTVSGAALTAFAGHTAPSRRFVSADLAVPKMEPSCVWHGHLFWSDVCSHGDAKKKTKACTEFVHSLGYASTVLQADGESTMREITTPLREKLAAHIQWSCESHTSKNSWFVTQQSAACAKKQWKERSTATSNLQKSTRYHLWIL